MSKIGVIFLLAVMGLTSAWSQESPQPFTPYRMEKEPFWRRKKRVYHRLREEREIIVSVTSKSSKKDSGTSVKQLFLKSAGLVQAPQSFSEREIQNYEKLVELSPKNFKKIEWNAQKSELFLHGIAMGWHARMWMKIWAHREKEKFFIDWHVIRGSFKGMKGVIQLEPPRPGRKVRQLKNSTSSKDDERRETEFSMTARYESEKLPLPAFLLSFGLEAVMKIVAKKMREHLEREFRSPEKLSGKVET